MPSPPIQQPLSTRLKRCSKCVRLRPLDHFYRCRRSPDGLFNECKACHSERRERNRKLKALGGPLVFNSFGRLAGIVFSAMELGVRSPKSVPKVLDMLAKILDYAERERAEQVARRAGWDEFRSLVHELPHAERLNLMKTIASTLPPKLRPKFKLSETEAVSPGSQTEIGSA